MAQKKPGGQGVGSGLPSRQEEPAGHFPLMAIAGHRCWCSCPGQRGRESMLLTCRTSREWTPARRAGWDGWLGDGERAGSDARVKGRGQPGLRPISPRRQSRSPMFGGRGGRQHLNALWEMHLQHRAHRPESGSPAAVVAWGAGRPPSRLWASGSGL